MVVTAVRTAWASEVDAIAAAREGVAADRQPRAVWFVDGASSAGWIVPARWIVGLAVTLTPPSANRHAVVSTAGISRGMCACATCSAKLRRSAAS